MSIAQCSGYRITKLSLFTLVPYKPEVNRWSISIIDSVIEYTHVLSGVVTYMPICPQKALQCVHPTTSTTLKPPMSSHVYRKLFTVANAEQLPAATWAQKTVHFQKPNRKMRKERKSSCKLYDTVKKLNKRLHTDGVERTRTWIICKLLFAFFFRQKHKSC